MLHCSYALYAELLKRYPPEPDSVADEAKERLAEVKARLEQTVSRDDLFDLEDCLDILARCQAGHAFLLGLDAGLTLAEELAPFQRI